MSDNGPEFSDPAAIEANPLFIERVHEEVRRVLVKGVSFQSLTW